MGDLKNIVLSATSQTQEPLIVGLSLCEMLRIGKSVETKSR